VPGETRRRVLRGVSLAMPTVLALAVLGGAAWATWRIGVAGELLRARAVRFEGLARVSETELRELSPVREGDHLLLTDLDGVEAALRRHPWIASVEVRRAFPPAFVVTVQERRAAALVDLGGLYLVDDRGQVFKRAAPGDGLDLPLLTGIGREDWVARRAEVEPVLAGALALLDRWSARGLDRRAPVSEIHVDPDFGVTVYAGDDGMEVRLGTGDLPQKLERLDRVLLALDAGKQRAEVVHLDNRRRPDWVAVRLAGVSGGGMGARAP
jgi:cell division protein FtsQ